MNALMKCFEGKQKNPYLGRYTKHNCSVITGIKIVYILA